MFFLSCVICTFSVVFMKSFLFLESIQSKAEGKNNTWGVSTLLFIYLEPINFHSCAAQTLLKYTNRFNFGNSSQLHLLCLCNIPHY